MNQFDTLPDGFRMTELGPLPEEWDVVRLEDTGEIITGRTPPTGNIAYWRGGTIPFITPVDLKDYKIRIAERSITEEGLKVSRGLPRGTITVSCIGYIGKLGIIDSSTAVTNQQINSIIPNNNVDNWYLAYLLMNNTTRMRNIARNTTVPILSKSNFQAIQIPLPPLPEQQRIAAILSSIQETREKTETTIQATKKLKHSMMKHLFTYGPTPPSEADSVPLKETEIGMMPEGWRVVKLGDVGKFQYGYTESSNETEIGPKFLRITDIDLDTSFVKWPTVPYCPITEEDYQKYALSDGDILIARIGATTGKTCIMKKPPKSVFASYLIRYTVNREFLYPFFTQYFMKAETYWSQINSGKEGKLKKGVSSGQLKQFLISMPPLPEQQRIAAILSSIDEKLQAEESKKQAIDSLFKTMLNDLMTAKIRVDHLDLEVCGFDYSG